VLIFSSVCKADFGVVVYILLQLKDSYTRSITEVTKQNYRFQVVQCY